MILKAYQPYLVIKDILFLKKNSFVYSKVKYGIEIKYGNIKYEIFFYMKGW